MDKILSVVVPTYNMEKYLATCLDSFIVDDKCTSLEVLVVNDGSKDSSLQIAREYEKKHPNIFKVIDKENGGHGSTINAGLKVAKGKYFQVVDADDYLNTQTLAELLKYLTNTSVDCVLTNYVCFYDACKKTIEKNITEIESYKVVDFEDVPTAHFSMHSVIFKTANLQANGGLGIQEKCFYVDMEYVLYSYARCKDCVYLPINLYYYRLGRDGQSVSLEGFRKHRNDHIIVNKNVIHFYEKLGNGFGNRKEKMFSMIVDITCYTYSWFNKLNYKDKKMLGELKQFDNWLKDFPEFYTASGKDKLIKTLRKNDFSRSKGRFMYEIKLIAKKILGRA